MFNVDRYNTKPLSPPKITTRSIIVWGLECHESSKSRAPLFGGAPALSEVQKAIPRRQRQRKFCAGDDEHASKKRR
jgi:hypothetical protein